MYNNYTTKLGDTLEVSRRASKYYGEYLYDFVVRSERPLGQALVVLATGLPLTDPTYMINKFIKEN